MAPQSPPDPSDPGWFKQDLKAYFDELKTQQRAPEELRKKLEVIPTSHHATRVSGDEAADQPSESSLWKLWWMPVPTAVMVLVLAFALHPPALTPSSPSPPQPHVIAKGTSWRILCARPHGGTTKGMLARELRPGQLLRPGDLIQFVYRTSQPIHVVILGVNQQGHIYPLVKTNAGQSVKLPKGSGVLPQKQGKARAFKLDRYVGQERFLIASAKRPFTYHALRQTLRRAWKKRPSLEALKTLPGPWQLDTLLFIKAKTPENTREK